MSHTLDSNEDKHILDIYIVDVLMAMQAWKRMWHDMRPYIIANCRRHTVILVESDINLTNILQMAQTNLELTMQGLEPARVRTPGLYLLSPKEKEDCYENVSDADFKQKITCPTTQEDTLSDEEGDEEVPHPQLKPNFKIWRFAPVYTTPGAWVMR